MFLPAATHIGSVTLTVSNLERAVRFYVEVMGFRAAARTEATVALGTSAAPALLELVELPGAQPRPPRSTGLYHFAVLVPDRPALARSLRQLVYADWPIQGSADHGVSEALYLADPDGNGIEIYVDRPRAQWPMRNGQLQMVTEPLDVASLLRELDSHRQPWSGLADATCIGHIHLHVADLRQAEAFYCSVLGFDLVQRYGASALFVSAGGYHHHIGLNTWAGIGAPPPPTDSAGLRFFTVTLPDAEALAQTVGRVQAAGWPVEEQVDGWHLQDPSTNGMRLVAPPAPPSYGDGI